VSTAAPASRSSGLSVHMVPGWRGGGTQLITVAGPAAGAGLDGYGSVPVPLSPFHVLFYST
jgi:hypothetical protein